MLNVQDEREATALKGLLHPNIIRLYRYWEAPSHNPKSHLLMELMAIDLSVYIESRLRDMASSSTQQKGEGEDTMPFSLPVAIDIMLQVGQAMQYLHDRHLTHRDLKTSNILVRRVSASLTEFYREGYLDIKLADFGLAKAYDNTSTSHQHSVKSGTPLYGAPEIFGKDLASERNFPPMADVWSFGVTCAEIVSGKKPYAEEPRGTLQSRIGKANLRPSLPKLCPEYLAYIIRGCWEFEPKRRPDFVSVCRMLRHAKLLSLGITSLDDSRSCMGYFTRGGFVKGLCDPKAPKAGIAWSLSTFFRTSLKCLSFSRIPGVHEISLEIPNEETHELRKILNKMEVENREAEEQRPNSLVFFLSRASFNLYDLKQASIMVLGRGILGTMYKAILEDGSIIVLKRLEEVALKTLGFKDFETRIRSIGNLRHHNLVPLRAYYFSENEKLLVYDYMPYGSLSEHLHGNGGSNFGTVEWVIRKTIAIGAASGLAYLHAQGQSFVHGNIKSSIILLKGYRVACISDFGRLQLLRSSASSRTVGIQAPEVQGTLKVTQESDVYSFGVVLLELLTGKEPPQPSANGEAIDLRHWVQSIVQEKQTSRVFDLKLMRYKYTQKEMVDTLEVAIQCVDAVTDRRPKMSDVLRMLEDVHPAPNIIVDELDCWGQ